MSIIYLIVMEAYFAVNKNPLICLAKRRFFFEIVCNVFFNSIAFGGK